MDAIALETVSKDQSGGFYVPEFEIRIAGQGVPEYIARDVLELTYTDNIEKMDSFQLTVNNWNPETNDFKYIGAENSGIDSESNADLSRVFEPCSTEVDIIMGYVGYRHTMMKGYFTTMEPSFPSSGASTLAVRGFNALHKLRRKKYEQGWVNKKDSEIALEISRANAQTNSSSSSGEGDCTPQRESNKRFPIPMIIPDGQDQREPSIEFIAQNNEFDIDFLWRRARERGYVIKVITEENSTTGELEEKLYFGSPRDETEPPKYELEWGKSLVDFKPTITTANQFKSVTVRGWNRERQEEISVTVDLNDDEVRRVNPDLHCLIQHCDAREEDVVDLPVFRRDEAERRARALLLDQTREIVKASGTTVGLPELRAGSRIQIKGLGTRISGEYFVTESTHTINNSGYITKFKARREQPAQGAQ
ncbi:MAG: phage late control D family protein [Arenicellales bacterium]